MFDRSKLTTYSLKSRSSKVSLEDIRQLEPIQNPISSSEFSDLIERVSQAKKDKRQIILMFGGHVVKTGLSRYIVDLMERGFITHIASNGSASIHDFELAFGGSTSEDVLPQLKDGSFGMARETGQFINEAINHSIDKDPKSGYGAAVGKMIEDKNLPNKSISLAWNARRLNIPYTVHVAIGTDIIHQHPSCDGAKLGLATYNDFLAFADSVSKLDGGVVLNIGSAVIMPEVFLKALSMARNIKSPTFNITTANFDMIDHYRTRVNVVERPTAHGGKGFNFTARHEISIPSLWMGLVKDR